MFEPQLFALEVIAEAPIHPPFEDGHMEVMYPRTLFLWCQTHGVSYYSEALARESQSGMYIIVGNHTIWEAVVWK